MTELIIKKRNGIELTKSDLDQIISGAMDGTIPDYQLSAFLMAVYFRGMSPEETVAFTQAIVDSGEVLDLSIIPGLKIDKHSTGGVGDKTTIILAPLVASAGVNVAKMSGRGIGHTGGTIDKLSSIPNLSTDVSRSDFLKNLRQIGIGYTEQTASLVPADKRFYALRDVTGTVKSIPLIAASIMSKKIASGADGIVLDVKCGNGAFMENQGEAIELASQMVTLGKGMGKKMTALVTNMNQPLGKSIGNSLEIIEAIEVLKGNEEGDLLELSLNLGAHMLLMANKVTDIDLGIDLLRQKIKSGNALDQFRIMINSLNGNADVIDNYKLFKQPLYSQIVKAPSDGYISSISALDLGRATMRLGAGRLKKEDHIDVSAGLNLLAKSGDKVLKNDPIAELFTDDKEALISNISLVQDAFTFSTQVPKPEPIVFDIIT